MSVVEHKTSKQNIKVVEMKTLTLEQFRASLNNDAWIRTQDTELYGQWDILEHCGEVEITERKHWGFAHIQITHGTASIKLLEGFSFIDGSDEEVASEYDGLDNNVQLKEISIINEDGDNLHQDEIRHEVEKVFSGVDYSHYAGHTS